GVSATSRARSGSCSRSCRPRSSSAAMSDRTSGFLHPLETASEDERRAHLDEVLRATVRIACDHVPYYRAKLQAAGISRHEDVGGVEDLPRIPITTKTEAGRERLGLGAFPLH